jgi:hypothetical protein
MDEMLLAIREAALQLPTLLTQTNLWVNSLDVDYHPPRVERVWTPFTASKFTGLQGKKYRLMLHVLHRCKAEEALFHPHPWPSSVAILEGVYDSYYGYGQQNGPEPPRIGPIMHPAGSVYVMSNPYHWHLVAPKMTTYSVMLIGDLYAKELQQERREDIWNLKGLKQERVDSILQYFARPESLEAFDKTTYRAVNSWV